MFEKSTCGGVANLSWGGGGGGGFGGGWGYVRVWGVICKERS